MVLAFAPLYPTFLVWSYLFILYLNNEKRDNFHFEIRNKQMFILVSYFKDTRIISITHLWKQLY